MTIPDQDSTKIVGESFTAETSTPETATKKSYMDSSKKEDTPEELTNIRHVRGKIPAVVWLLAFTGASQRFAYYGTTIPWRKILL
jgi:hypothetical protein